MSKPRILYWFRTDLRLHDSPALHAALSLSPEVLYPIFTFDPHYVYRARVGPNRWQFLLDCMRDLSASITELNPNSKLFVVREAPQTVLPKLFKEWRITHLVFEKDTDAYARDRDEAVVEAANKSGVEVVTRVGRTLWDPDEVVKQNKGKPTMSIRQLQAVGAKVGAIPKPLPKPKSLPDSGSTDLSPSFPHSKPDPNSDDNAPHRNNEETTYISLAGPDNTFSIPTLTELGLPPATTPHRGGETLALRALDSLLKNPTYLVTFSKPSTSPTDCLPQSTTLLSPHLHFGSLSPRHFYWSIQATISTYAGPYPATKPPTSLPGQLLFRDMYFAAQAALGHKFAQAYANPTTRSIPWHLPSVISPSTGLRDGHAYTVDSEKAERNFQRWRNGQTGFPFIDALMRQLRQEGWIHHLGRHAVACFLTRGGCYIDWERGADVFEELLIDHETCANSGNWQWLACTAFFSGYQRVYSPVAFGKKWDPEGVYVRRYVPELEKFGKEYIYEPWKAPVADQRAWGCLIKGDGTRGEPSQGDMRTYPKPIFDFSAQKEICMQGMKKAYSVGLYGDDKRVLNGSWRALFPDNAEGPTEGEDGLPGAQVPGCNSTNDGDQDEDEGRSKQHDLRQEEMASKVVGPKRTAEGRFKRAVTGKRNASQNQGTLDGFVKRKRALT